MCPYFIFMVVSLHLMYLVAGQSFGYDGRYNCHCSGGDCQQLTGLCSSNRCERGWHGPSCQKQNVALDQRSSQSSYFRPDWLSSNANDGNTDQTLDPNGSPLGVCVHTARYDSNSYWDVNFQMSYPINQVKIYYRKNSYLRLRGFELYLLKAPFELCYKQEELPTTDILLLNCSGAMASGVRFYNSRSRPTDLDPGVVELCEMQVFVCAQGTFGINCSSHCYCKSREDRCDFVTGQCPDGCATGFTGNTCSEICPPDRYGELCQKSCSDRNCLTSATCNHVTGSCAGSCSPGFIGDDCTQECSPGNYGYNCSGLCSARLCSNQSTSACNYVDGKCDQGCKPGYKSPDCAEECSDNTYGQDCAFRCDDRKCAEVSDCPVSDGRCTGGCVQGINTIDCRGEKQTAGNVVLYVCIALGVVLVVALIPGMAFLFRNRCKLRDTFTDVKPVGDKEIIMNPIMITIDDTRSEIDSLAGSIDEEENMYYNIGCNEGSVDTSVLIHDLDRIVREMRELNSFETQYRQLPSGFFAPYDQSQIAENRKKNRYQGYYPYDKNRVRLSKQGDDPHSDYINASYIDGYQAPNYFIAAQGATKTTLNDFVRMIFEEKCDKVVMLTNLVEGNKMKCEQYWPSDREQEFGDLKLTMVREVTRANYVTREIELKHMKNGKKHTTMLFHFTAWADHDVPEVADLLEYLYHIHRYKPMTTSPTLVHCSAGIGRTGTYIAIDALMKEGDETGKIDVQGFVKRMREQRKKMIQTTSQLEFVYNALLEVFSYGKTSLTCSKYVENFTESFHMGLLTRAEQVAELNKLQREVSSCQKIYIQGKPDLRVFRAQSWKKRVGFIISDIQNHDEESVWDLVKDQDSSMVVFILDEGKDKYIPQKGHKMKTGTSSIITDGELQNNKPISSFAVTINSDEGARKCHLIDINLNENNDLQLGKLQDCINLVNSLEDSESPIVIFASDVGQAVLFCILKNIIERIRVDDDVEIFTTARKVMQSSLEEYDISQEEYNWLHTTAFNFIAQDTVYANLS